MKIGIINFYSLGDNYGSMMQCYATQQYMRNLGHDVYIILHGGAQKKNLKVLIRKLFHALNPYIFIRHFYLKFKNRAVIEEQEMFPRHFDEFFNKYVNQSPINYSDVNELKKNPPEADVYCVGSDQTWNFRLLKTKKNIDMYFLNFGSDKVHRIAYAPSIGENALSDYYKETIIPLLKKFSAISVREKKGQELLKEMGFYNAKWVCDPSFLLTADQYRKVYSENPIRKQDKKYLLFYWLGKGSNKIDFDVDTIYDFAKEKGLEVVLVTGNQNTTNREKFFATVPEWLYLIDNAEYVVTNSFHGSVFSTIFGKQYGTIPLIEEHSGGNTRVDSLFECCHIEPRWLKKGEGFSILDKPYTADISSFRAESLHFLEEALNMTEGGGKRPIGFALRSKKQHKPTYLIRNRLLFVQSRSPSIVNREEV